MTHEIDGGPGPIVMDMHFWVATIVFVIALIIIISEKIHKTIVAIFAASLVIIFKILHQYEAFHIEELGVDWNVIFLLINMMIIINLIRPTGLFEYIAIRSAKIGKGEPVKIMMIFGLVTAVLSALLDNVTTVLLLAPVILLICEALEIDPVPMLIVQAMAANIGGTATLIGDPPNIMIASKAGLSFIDFINNLAPVVVVLMAVFLWAMKMVFGKKMETREELKQRIMDMDENDAIKDPVLIKKSLTVLGLVLMGFTLHGVLHYQPATIAFFGAGLLLIISGTTNPEKVLASVEWPTIFFFIGLFIIVGGVVKVGLVGLMSGEMLDLTQGNLFATSMVLMWFSAFASAIVDNIPYVATMNPLVIDMAGKIWPHETGMALLQHPDLMPVWWSLALGACLGGNGSPIGASANVIIVGTAEKAGRKISFLRFVAYGLPIMVSTVAVSMVYVWVRYYVLGI